MKPLFKFINTTILGGILFLVPIVALVFIIGKALPVAQKIGDRFSALVPFKSVIGLRTPVLMAILLLVLCCFLAGLLTRLAVARNVVHRLEQSALSKIPGYALLRSILPMSPGDEEQQAYKVILVNLEDCWQIGLLVEEPENGLVTVFVPDAPNPRSGSVHLIAEERIRPADISLVAAFKCLRHFGAGSGALRRSLAAEVVRTRQDS